MTHKEEKLVTHPGTRLNREENHTVNGAKRSAKIMLVTWVSVSLLENPEVNELTDNMPSKKGAVVYLDQEPSGGSI